MQAPRRAERASGGGAAIHPALSLSHFYTSHVCTPRLPLNFRHMHCCCCCYCCCSCCWRRAIRRSMAPPFRSSQATSSRLQGRSHSGGGGRWFIIVAQHEVSPEQHTIGWHCSSDTGAPLERCPQGSAQRGA